MRVSTGSLMHMSTASPQYRAYRPDALNAPMVRKDAGAVGVWAALLKALHQSRRQDAEREIRRYRHLVQGDVACALAPRGRATGHGV